MSRNSLHLDGPFLAAGKRQAERFISNYFYQGALQLAPDGSQPYWHLEETVPGPYPIYGIRTASPVSFSRTPADIRADGADFCAIRLLKSGIAKITQAGRTVEMAPGDIVMNRSTLPVRVEISTGPDGAEVEMLIALIPSVMLHEQVDLDAAVNQKFPRFDSHFRVLHDLLQLLAQRSGDIDDECGELLANTMFREVAKLGASMASISKTNQSVSAAHLSNIRAKIRTHFSNPTLSLKTIAQKCGISPRYVTYIMKKFGTSFYDELKVERLNAAKRMLQSVRQMPMKQIAFYTGFKSAAHFSAAYKREFGYPPSVEAKER